MAPKEVSQGSWFLFTISKNIDRIENSYMSKTNFGPIKLVSKLPYSWKYLTVV